MTNVFISYAREDKPRVAQLVALVDQWIDEVWWDDRLVAGARFTTETEQRLNAADYVIVVWSPDSVRSEWVLDEAEVGKSTGKLIPLSLDGQTPPLGFRHIQTIDFGGFAGDAGAPCVAALQRALGEKPPPPIAQTPATKTKARVMAAAIALAALSASAVVFFLATRPPAAEKRIAAITADLIAGRAASDPYAAEAKRAVAAIGASPRAEDRAALSSFEAGDQTGALDILEQLAAELERAGDFKAAGETYTRVGAIALLVDQGRGLAARQKALELSPESLEGFQGLFFDTFLLKGYDAAAAFAEGVIARPKVSDRLKGFAYAHLAIIAMDGKRDAALAEERVGRVKAIAERTKDPVLEAAALYASATIDWRRDRLIEAERGALAARAIKLDGAHAFPSEVVMGRIKFSQGDWAGAFSEGLAVLSARRRDGRFLPTPLLHIVCRSGLYIGEVEKAAPFCEAQEGRTDQAGGAGFRIITGELALARGDIDKARSELAASRALAGGGPDGLGGLAEIAAEQLRLEAAIAGAAGDLDVAQSLVWRYADDIAREMNARSLRASALRLFGMSAIKANAPARACSALAESGDLYAAIGGAAGVDATRALAKTAGCP